jgi:hypothetical protein
MTQSSSALNESDPVGSAFSSLIGSPAWGVQKGQGSMLTFEFGAPHLSIREPISNPLTDNPKIRKILRRRHVALHGEWYLWIGTCHWRCSDGGNEQCTDLSPDEQIVEAAKLMDGQKLVSVEVEPETGRSQFGFDLGAILETWPYADEDNDEQWSLYTPSNYVLGYRADGHYSWTPSDQPPHREKWLPLPRKA